MPPTRAATFCPRTVKPFLLLQVLVATLTLFLVSSCIVVYDADREDPAFILGILISSRTPKIEVRSLQGKEVTFSNFGAILYPKGLSRHLVGLLVYREEHGHWPNEAQKLILDHLTCEQTQEPPYLRISVSDPNGEPYQIYLDRDLMTSVRPHEVPLAEKQIEFLRKTSRQ